MTWHVGLTGGICCGKSTLAHGLRQRNWRVIDSDEIAHRLMQPGEELYKKVIDVFGQTILSSNLSIDRKVLGKIAFSDPSARTKLNEITHPAIRSVWQRERDEQVRLHPLQPLVVMIPLLFESQLEKMFSSIWSVGASRTVQIQRLRERGFSEIEAGQRIDSQYPVLEKMNRADLAFWGEGPSATLLRQLEYLPT